MVTPKNPRASSKIQGLLKKAKGQHQIHLLVKSPSHHTAKMILYRFQHKRSKFIYRVLQFRLHACSLPSDVPFQGRVGRACRTEAWPLQISRDICDHLPPCPPPLLALRVFTQFWQPEAELACRNLSSLWILHKNDPKMRKSVALNTAQIGVRQGLPPSRRSFPPHQPSFHARRQSWARRGAAAPRGP